MMKMSNITTCKIDRCTVSSHLTSQLSCMIAKVGIIASRQAGDFVAGGHVACAAPS
jgi:hypothetical protein